MGTYDDNFLMVDRFFRHFVVKIDISITLLKFRFINMFFCREEDRYILTRKYSF